MLAVLIGLLTFLTWHFTKIYTTKSLNSLAYDLRYELLQRPILRMWNILNSTAEITTAQVKLSEYVIRSHTNIATQEELLEVDSYAIHILVLCYLLYADTICIALRSHLNMEIAYNMSICF